MPQVIISLPTAIFPLLAHILNLQGDEQDSPPPLEPQPAARDPRASRRSHTRHSRRQPPAPSAVPRHRMARHNLRYRRGSLRNIQDPTQRDATTSSSSNLVPEPLKQNDQPSIIQSADDIVLEATASSSSLSPPATPPIPRIRENGKPEEVEEIASSPLSDTASAGSAFGEEEEEETESDSEQSRIFSPESDDHDGDEDTEGRRRRRWRGNERSAPATVERERDRDRDRERERERDREREREAETPEVNGEANNVNNNPSANTQPEEREGGESRGFIGNGWWFLALLLIVQLYQSGGFLFLCMLLLYVGFNSSAMLTYRSKSWKYRLTFLSAATIIPIGTIAFIYWKFKEERLWLYLAFIPGSTQFNVSNALWIVWVNEFIVVFLTIVLKHYLIITCASFRVFGQSTKKKMLALIEQASKLYRSVLPIPVWLLYLYNSFGEEGELVKIRGLAFSGIYIYFVAVNIHFIGTELLKIIEHKTPEEMCHRATTDDINKYTEDCAICREDLGSRAPLRLPCSHVFCTECIYQWFDKHPSCPTCRSKIGTEDMFEESSGNTNIHLQENGIGLSVSFDDM